jgi:pSer/pThr/pTyr-binding forkhead associated (FHA) protein
MVSYCLVSPLFTPRVRILRKGRRYVLGRDAACDFPLPSEVVSRRHAEIEWNSKGGFAIRDLGSRNGTRVNDDRVDWRLLKDGDRLTLGPFCLHYREYDGDISDLLEATKSDGDKTLSMSRGTLDSAHGALGFAGRFAGHELLEICQLIALNEKDGTLRIEGEGVSGEIRFFRGEIVHARAGGIEEREAALKLLTLPSGRFEFAGGNVEAVPPKLRTQSLIMEAARLRDEITSKQPIAGPKDIAPEPKD